VPIELWDEIIGVGARSHYGIGRAAVSKMTADTSFELAEHHVSVISIWPGMVRTELIEAGVPKDDDGNAYVVYDGVRVALNVNGNTPFA
jgi:NAD(P)-dependent dehydrogenase (short-subunit alcohol dehydrogenase family)